MEQEGKNVLDIAFKNLAAYQHQNFLRKADEQGLLKQTLKAEAKKSRQPRKDVPISEPVG
jgi:hypothetical protein